MTNEIAPATPPASGDLRTLAKLVIYGAIVLAAAAVLGLAVRVFVMASGMGG